MLKAPVPFALGVILVTMAVRFQIPTADKWQFSQVLLEISAVW
jgi:hypothetical protein